MTQINRNLKVLYAQTMKAMSMQSMLFVWAVDNEINYCPGA